MRARNQGGEAGFVFPYVLGFIAILAMLSSIFLFAVQSLAARQALVGDQLSFSLAARSRTAEVAFARLTGLDVSHASLEGCLEREEQSFIVPGTLSRDGASRLFGGGDNEVSPGALSAALLDYVDEDVEQRFLGAERAAYREQGVLGPANAPLRSLTELEAVLGWRDALEGLGDGALATQFTIYGGPAIHLGDASATALQARLEISREDAQTLRARLDSISDRGARVRVEDLIGAFRRRSQSGPPLLLGGDTAFFSLFLWSRDLRFAERRVIQAMPNGVLRPFAVRERLELDAADRARLREIVAGQAARQRWACSGAPEAVSP